MGEREAELHLYGFVREGTSAPDVRGVEDAPIEIVGHGGVGAVVSGASAPPRPSRAALMAHAAVLDVLLDAEPVLPVRFGHRLRDRPAARGLLAERHVELTGLLTRLVGRVQMQVTATYLEDPILVDIACSDFEVQRLRRAIQGRSVTATLPERSTLGEDVARQLAMRREHDGRLLLAVLEPVLCDVALEPVSDLDVLRAHLLVERSRVADVTRLVERLAAEHADYMELRCSGPLPPYSFVSGVTL